MTWFQSSLYNLFYLSPRNDALIRLDYSTIKGINNRNSPCFEVGPHFTFSACLDRKMTVLCDSWCWIISEGKSPDVFFKFPLFLHLFPELVPELYKSNSISTHTSNTLLNNTVESSTIFHSNLMLYINWFYEI
jgi:hypothetical protein